ncbi:helix-turn-helix domain-containing protein [Phocaeicola vulgatus]|nr:helix-turn-helix domain-containing protein [Phocaeicola vulgatus]
MSQNEFEKLIVVPFLCIIILKKRYDKRKKAVSTAESSKEKGMRINSGVSESIMIVSDIIGIDEVCKITSLSRSTIYKKTSNHEIPFYKSTLNKRSFLRFRRSEILNWMLRHRIGTIDEFLESQD